MAPRSKAPDAAAHRNKPAADRRDRLSAALKANMAKRKAQARARADGGDAAGDTAGTRGADGAGGAADTGKRER